MDYCIIPLTSVTNAKRFEKNALSSGIPSSVTVTPKGISKHGCSHALRLRLSDAERCIVLGKSLGFKMGGVFKEVKEKNMPPYYVRLEQYDDLL